MSWTDKPDYEPAPPVDQNPWYDAPLPLAPETEEREGPYSFVYLMQSGNAYKIGFSRNVLHRLGDLNCAASERVEVVALRRGDQGLERRIHKRLAAHRLNGEWFRACPEAFKAFYSVPECDDAKAVA